MFQDVANSLLEYLRDNWPELIWIVAAAGIASYVAGYRTRSRWRKRNFLDRLNVSLTSIDNGQLKIRTILEMDCQDIFLNSSAAAAVVKYASQTTENDPLLPIPKDDCWQYLNAVLNEISERFAAGQVKQDMGLPVRQGSYLLCLTCERAGPMRTQKIRGMLIRKQLLESLPDEEPTYEAPTHSTRWVTLKQLAQLHKERPSAFLEMEICL